MTPDLVTTRLAEGTLDLIGRIDVASNATFVGTIDGTRVVYKPIAGEQPLWDFPDGRLAYREVAAHLVSQALGVRIVPPTLLREGPYGEGMVQLWCEPDVAQQPVTIVPAGQVPAGYLHVFDGLGYDDEPVALVHEDSAALRRMALFDAVINNADRKGGHVLPVADGHRYGVDHGIAFHSEPKLRTVLWGWAGQALHDGECEALIGLRRDLDGPLGDELGFWLASWDLDALRQRVDLLLEARTMPRPDPGRAAIPWPPF